jgi:hypothetical protein
VTDLAPSGGSDAAPANDSILSIREAADTYAQRREKEAQAAPAEEAPPPKARDERGKFARSEPDPEIPSQEESTAEDEAPPPGDDDQGTADPAPEEPSVEPPRSWTKDEKEAFKLLPPEHQQRIAERERTREADIRRGQDETAKIRKAAEAERTQLEQARQQYEAALPQMLQELNAITSREFSDIRSWDDVQKLSREDWPRYVEWDAHQKRLQAAKVQHQQAEGRRQQEQQEKWNSYVQEQDAKVKDLIPELADPAKAKKVQQEAYDYLTEVVGFDKDRLSRSWHGQEPLYLQDAQVQRIIRDAAKWVAAEKAAKAAASKSLPPVQRPGTPVSKADQSSAAIKTLETKLSRSTNVRDQIRLAAELRGLKRG